MEKRQFAYDYLKEKIIIGEIAPSSDISEKKLQEILGVGRTPIHEAIQRLCDDGFVQIYPRKGTFVTEISLKTVQAVHEARFVIEPYLAKVAAEKLPRPWLEEMLESLERAVDEDDIVVRDAHLMCLDTALHTKILECTDNVFLKENLKKVYDHARRFCLRTITNPAQIETSRLEHIQIVQAMLDQDMDALEQISMYHVNHSRDLLYATLGLVGLN